MILYKYQKDGLIKIIVLLQYMNDLVQGFLIRDIMDVLDFLV